MSQKQKEMNIMKLFFLLCYAMTTFSSEEMTKFPLRLPKFCMCTYKCQRWYRCTYLCVYMSHTQYACINCISERITVSFPISSSKLCFELLMAAILILYFYSKTLNSRGSENVQECLGPLKEPRPLRTLASTCRRSPLCFPHILQIFFCDLLRSCYL